MATAAPLTLIMMSPAARAAGMIVPRSGYGATHTLYSQCICGRSRNLRPSVRRSGCDAERQTRRVSQHHPRVPGGHQLRAGGTHPLDLGVAVVGAEVEVHADRAVLTRPESLQEERHR